MKVPDECVHVEEVQEAVDAIEDRIEEIEGDDRYDGGENPAESAEIQTNAVLALMQTEWSGELRGLKRARNLLEDIS